MEVFGHRGAAGEAPENTIAGCRHAIERGTRNIEVDLRLSSEGELVVLHDKKVNRTTYSRGQVYDYSVGELGKMNATKDAPPWEQGPDTGIPSLRALIDQTPEVECYQLEVKSDTKERMKVCAERLADFFPTKASAEGIVVTSMDYHLHRYLMKQAPHIVRGMVALKLDAFNMAGELNCKYYCCNWSILSPMFLRELRRKKFHVSVWTVNDERTIKNFHRMKVDSLITDYPSMALPLVSRLSR